MKKFLTFFALTILSFSSFAQKHRHQKMHTPPTNKAVWSKGLQFSLYAGQAGGKNWASGSNVFSLSANTFLNGFANLKRGKWFWNNALAASYGLVLTDETTTIKSDDKLDYFSTLGISLKKKNSTERSNSGIGAAFNFRSQFSDGFDRNYLNQGLKRRTSGFFAPAYITIAPVGYIAQLKHFTFFATPIAFRGVIVSNQPYSYAFQAGTIPGSFVNAKNPSTRERSVAEMYGVDANKTIRYETGPYLSAQYDKELCQNVTWSGRLDAFSDFNHNDNINLFLTNTLLFKVNNWLNATYSVDMAYADYIKIFGYYKNGTALQLKSVLGIGISLNCGSHMRMHEHKGKRKNHHMNN